ncbi:MAG: pyridoxamine 5'-phosphate oxidase family protein [Bacteroidales bacterium]|nr:pyridoxamine 5'-phosphate oxidase family protein [Bacteroidales bacterium]
MMEEIITYLKKSGIQYFATVGLDGKPKVRPFQFMFEYDNKLWFCTSNEKEVYKELQKQPYVEICTLGPKMSWIRLEGKVNFSDSLEMKEKVFRVNALVRNIYKEIDNPLLEVFYLSEVKATISEIGEKPVVYAMND